MQIAVTWSFSDMRLPSIDVCIVSHRDARRNHAMLSRFLVFGWTLDKTTSFSCNIGKLVSGSPA